MPRKKLIKITEVNSFPNVFNYKTNNVWSDIKNYFDNPNPIIIELGCGQADYTINLAKLNPDKNFIGIDRKGNRIWSASKIMSKENLPNAALMIGHAESLNEAIPENSISEIWITFPDPYPRRGSMKRRLTHPRFLEVYKKILHKDGIINLKTDDDALFDYTVSVIKEKDLRLIKAMADIYSLPQLSEVEKITTKYEKQHLAEGKKIKLVSFCL
jgi:tRNA (guanine-N7-)-methyltransferase